MRDILLVKPIPRLLLAFESMDAEALMDAAVRLAKQDWRLTRHQPLSLVLECSWHVKLQSM
jgi:hypothetical protein